MPADRSEDLLPFCGGYEKGLAEIWYNVGVMKIGLYHGLGKVGPGSAGTTPTASRLGMTEQPICLLPEHLLPGRKAVVPVLSGHV